MSVKAWALTSNLNGRAQSKQKEVAASYYNLGYSEKLQM